MRWILDGYNVILTDERLAKVAKNDLEAARRELTATIASNGRLRHEQVLVVFDGKSAGSAEQIAPNIETRFTGRGETADDFIKRTIGLYRKRRSVFVVSDDHSIISYAKECGANVVSGRDFLHSLREPKNGKRTKEPPSEKPAPPMRSDPELLRLFKQRKRDD
jgi:predicted RNA-binding protein with PIN domain